MNVKIKDMPVLERPRERLIRYGVEMIGTEELLAILIKDGTKNISAKMIALNLLKESGCVSNLKNVTYEKLVEMKGIGEAKACVILAAIELGKRILTVKDDIINMKIDKVEKVFAYYKNIIGSRKQECFCAIYLNNRNIVLKDKILFVGTINASLVHPREVFKEAYLLSASSIICVHNHPSGNIEPSPEDVEMTLRIVEVGKLLGIKVLDHLVISENAYYSFLENGGI